MGFQVALLALALLLGACTGPSNHPPQIASLQASPTDGEAPLAVRFTWTVQDPDGDALNCVLKPGDGATLVLNPCGTSYTYTYANPGGYTFSLKVSDEKGGTDQKSTSVRVYPKKDFTISLNPTSLTIQQGASGQTTLTLTPQGGFTGQVSLSLVGAPQGVTLSPTTVSVSDPNNPVTQTLTVNVASGVAAGSYSLQVRATSGNIIKTANLSLAVTPSTNPDFTMVLESNSLSITPGGTSYVRLAVTGNGGTLSLSLVDSNGAPFASVSLSPSTTPIPSAPMLELSASPSLAPGTYPLKVLGTSNGITKEAPLTLEVTSSTVNLRILKTEWGQTVLKEGLRLVAGKEALLRVHLRASPSPVSISQPLSGAVYQGGTFRGNLNFTCPNPIPTSTAQGDLSTTCNATLPGNWVTQDLRVELLADPNNQVAETDESDNALTLNPSVGAGTVLHLTVVPVIHQGQNPTIPNFSQTLWRIWPLQSITSTTRAPYVFSGALGPTDGNAWSQLLDELRILRQADGSGRYYYGFVRVTYTSGIAGIGYIGYPVATGWDNASSAPIVMAHELGHNFGREHAPCGTSGDPNYPYPNGRIGTWGYDLESGTLRNPSERYDLMSYCHPQWISDYNYEAAQSFLEGNPPRPQSLPQEGLLFSGRIRGDEVVFNPPLRLATRPEGRPSSYRLRVDGVEVPVYVLEDSLGTLHFQALLPVGSWNRAELWQDGVLLKRVEVGLRSLAEPNVELREEGGFVAVRWTGYPYLSLAHVSEEGTRTTLGLFAREGEARFPTEGLPQGGWFEVQLSDGLSVRLFSFFR